jgi:demethylmenaquinone methyltransferase/2-methoxy-6-polyprenyl-1,4-benzoquinol methylase
VEVTGARAGQVRAMFTRIARRYDLMNSLMTAGRHHAWRRVAARAAVAAPPGPVLDLATGTADLALAIRDLDPGRRVVGADFSAGMLGEARRKLGARAERAVTLVAGDALRLPFADGSFACVTSAFLLRNLEDLPGGLTEMKRVTAAGGRVVTLDITSPALRGWAPVFNLYFRRVVPAIGALVAGDRQAYTYLPQSVARFVTPDALAALMAEAGLRNVRYQRLGLGTIAIHVAGA